METLEEVSFKLHLEKVDGIELTEIKENRAWAKFQDSDVSWSSAAVKKISMGELQQMWEQNNNKKGFEDFFTSIF